MKTLIKLAVLFATANAFAGPISPNSDWSEIFANKKARVTVEYNLSGQSLNNICVNSQKGLQTIEPVAVCLDTQEPIKCSIEHWPCDTTCKNPAFQVVEIPRTYTVNYCESFRKPLNGHYPDCAKPASAQVVIPDVMNADVYRLTGNFGGESGNSYYSFTKKFEIPACK